MAVIYHNENATKYRKKRFSNIKTCSFQRKEIKSRQTLMKPVSIINRGPVIHIYIYIYST